MCYRRVALGYRLALCIKFTAAPVPLAARNRQPLKTNPSEARCLLRAPRLLQLHTQHKVAHAIKTKQNCQVVSENRK